MAYQYPSGLDFASGRDAGLAAAYNKERARALRAGTVTQELTNQRFLDNEYIRELELRGAIKTTVVNGHAQYTIDKSKFLPAELLEFLQRTTPEITEYSVYDEAGERTGYESMIMEDILGKTDEDGNMKYLISGRRPDGKRSFMDRRRRKGASDDKDDLADITGTTLDMLANAGLQRLLSKDPNAKNYSANVMMANNDPTVGVLAQRDEIELAALRRRKVNIGIVQDAKAAAGDNRKEFLDIMDGILSDPAIKGTNSMFDLVNSAAPYWEALGGDTSDIITSDQVIQGQGAAPIDTGRYTNKNRKVWEDPDTGVPYSEKTITFQTDDGNWINMPTVDENGMSIPQIEIEDYVRAKEAAGKQITDPITGEERPKWPSEKEARRLAELRSLSLDTGDGELDEGAESGAVTLEDLKVDFTDEGVQDLDGMMRVLQNRANSQQDLYKMMRLVAGTQEEPATAMLEMERRLISPEGFVSDPKALYPSGTTNVRSEPGVVPKVIDLSKDIFFTNLETLGAGQLEYDEELGKFVITSVNKLSGIDNKTDVDNMIAQNRGLQLRLANGMYDSDIEKKQVIKNTIFDTARDIVALLAQEHGKKSWKERVALFRPLRGERWMSDARADTRPGILWKANPGLPVSTLTAHRDNLRLVVGADATIQQGMLGAAHEMPRIYIQNANGQETKASMPLSHVISLFNNIEQFDKWLEATFSDEEYQKFDKWRLEGFLDDYTAAAGIYAPGRSLRSPMKEEELQAAADYVPANLRGMAKP